MEVLKNKVVTTRKEHQCFGCNEIYPPGTKMEYTVSVDQGDFLTAYWCLICIAVMYEWHYEDCQYIEQGSVKSGDPEIWEEFKIEVEEEKQ